MTSLGDTVQEQVEGHEDKGIATLLKMQQTNPQLLVGVALENLIGDAKSGNAQKVLQSGMGVEGQPSVLDRQASALADGSLLNAASRVGPGIQQRGNQIAQQQRYPGQQPGIGGQPGLGGRQLAQNQRRPVRPGMQMNMQARNPAIGTPTPTGLPTMRSNLPQAAAQGGIIGYQDGGPTGDPKSGLGRLYHALTLKPSEMDIGLQEAQRQREERGKSWKDYVPYLGENYADISGRGGDRHEEIMYRVANVLQDTGVSGLLERKLSERYGEAEDDPRFEGKTVLETMGLLGQPEGGIAKRGPALLPETETFLNATETLDNPESTAEQKAFAQMQLEGLKDAPMRAEIMQQVDQIRSARRGMAGGGIVSLRDGGPIKRYQQGDQVEGGGGFSDWRRRWFPNPTVNLAEVQTGEEFLLEQGFSWDQINDMKDSEIAEWGHRRKSGRRGTTGDLMELFQRFGKPLVGDTITELPPQRGTGASAASLAQIDADRQAALNIDGPPASTDPNVLPNVTPITSNVPPETSGWYEDQPRTYQPPASAPWLQLTDKNVEDMTPEERFMRRLIPPEGRYEHTFDPLVRRTQPPEDESGGGIGSWLGKYIGEIGRYAAQDVAVPATQYGLETLGDFVGTGYESSGLKSAVGQVDQSGIFDPLKFERPIDPETGERQRWSGWIGDQWNKYSELVDEKKAEMEAEAEAERLQDEHQRGLEGFGASLETAIEEGLTDEERLQKLLSGGYGKWGTGDVLEDGEFVGSGVGGDGVGGVGTRRDRIDGDTSGVAGQVTTDPNVWDQIQRVTNILGKGAGSSAGWEGINISKGLQAERALEAERGFEADQLQKQLDARLNLEERSEAAAMRRARAEALIDAYPDIDMKIRSSGAYGAKVRQLEKDYDKLWGGHSLTKEIGGLTFDEALDEWVAEEIKKEMAFLGGQFDSMQGSSDDALGDIEDYSGWGAVEIAPTP